MCRCGQTTNRIIISHNYNTITGCMPYPQLLHKVLSQTKTYSLTQAKSLSAILCCLCNRDGKASKRTGSKLNMTNCITAVKPLSPPSPPPPKKTLSLLLLLSCSVPCTTDNPSHAVERQQLRPLAHCCSTFSTTSSRHSEESRRRGYGC